MLFFRDQLRVTLPSCKVSLMECNDKHRLIPWSIFQLCFFLILKCRNLPRNAGWHHFLELFFFTINSSNPWKWKNQTCQILGSPAMLEKNKHLQFEQQSKPACLLGLFLRLLPCIQGSNRRLVTPNGGFN